MRFRAATLIAGAAIALSALPAFAQQYAFTAKSVHLRAGPGRDYPVVAILPPRTSIGVIACISGYSWCDVAAGPDRGWVYAGNIEYAYDGRDVLLPGIATVLGIAITTFIIDDYWHDHYIDRPWWPQRHRWYRPAPPQPVRPMPPPPPRAMPAPNRPPPHVEGRPQGPARVPDARPQQPRPPQQQPQVRPQRQPQYQQTPRQAPQQPRERPRDQGE